MYCVCVGWIVDEHGLWAVDWERAMRLQIGFHARAPLAVTGHEGRGLVYDAIPVASKLRCSQLVAVAV